MDSGDKATNKAMSVAFKYACFQVFCIPTEDMTDPDAETPPPSVPVISVQQIEELKKEMMRTGVTAKTVLQMAKIATIEEMNLPTFEVIMKKFSKTPDKIPDPAPQDMIPDQLDDNDLPFA